jgi:hypothetical protein
VRGIHNALRREACWHGAGIGIENHGVEAIFDYLRRAEKHRCPVTGVDELDAGVGGAGQIVGDYSDLRHQVSGYRLQVWVAESNRPTDTFRFVKRLCCKIKAYPGEDKLNPDT